MPEIQFFENILHGDELRDIFLDDVGLGLFDIVGDLPDMDGIYSSINQPHLIDNNYQHNIIVEKNQLCLQNLSTNTQKKPSNFFIIINPCMPKKIFLEAMKIEIGKK